MWEVNDKNFKKEVLDSNIPVLVDFYAEWCAPCKKISSIIEEITKRYKDKIKVCKLNIDESPKIASEYGILSIPTLVFFKDGKIQDTIIGLVPKSLIEERINLYI